MPSPGPEPPSTGPAEEQGQERHGGDPAAGYPCAGSAQHMLGGRRQRFCQQSRGNAPPAAGTVSTRWGGVCSARAGWVTQPRKGCWQRSLCSSSLPGQGGRGLVTWACDYKKVLLNADKHRSHSASTAHAASSHHSHPANATVSCKAPHPLNPPWLLAPLTEAPCPMFTLLQHMPPHVVCLYPWWKLIRKHRQVMVSLQPHVEPFCAGWLLWLLPTGRSCQIRACVCFPLASFQHLANPSSLPVVVAGLPKAKPRVLYVISRLDLGQLKISWSGRWGDAVPAHTRLQRPKLAGWPSAANLCLQSHVVPSHSTGSSPPLHTSPPQGVESPGRGQWSPRPHTLQAQSWTCRRA